MATFTVSPAVASALTARATNPALGPYTTTSPYSSASLTFLNEGAIQFLDSSLNVLAGFGFYPVGYQIFTSISVIYSGTVIGSSTAQFNTTTGRVDINLGLVLQTSFGNYQIYSYNSGTGVALGTLISGIGYNGTQAGNVLVAGGHAVRTADASTGYTTFGSFPTTTPLLSGTIEYVLLRDKANTFGITFTAGDIGSGADVEINDRTLTTAQPWQLSGSIRVRLPMSYTYTL